MLVVNNTTPPLADSLLIVDDNEIIREVLSHQFKQNGYNCTAAGDGKRAFELTSQQRFDLILLDIEMPEMPGLEFLKILVKPSRPQSFRSS